MSIAEIYQPMPDTEWEQFLTGEVAFVKSGFDTAGRKIYLVFSADGTFIVSLCDCNQAFFEVKRNGLEPLWVH